MKTHARLTHRFLFVLCLLLFSPLSIQAQLPPEGESQLDQLTFGHPDLFISNSYKPIYLDQSLSAMSLDNKRPDILPAELTRQLKASLKVLESESGLFDVRTGRWGTLIQSEPLIPGSGVGNKLGWQSLGVKAPEGEGDLKSAAFAALKEYLSKFQAELKVQIDELDKAPNIAVHEGGKIIQINIQRVVEGVPVRNAYLTATLNSGNLILFGTRNWGDLSISTRPTISEQEAIDKVHEHAQAYSTGRHWRKPHLAIVPLAQGQDLDRIVIGRGLRFRLVWVISPVFEGSNGSWEGIVDARTGELLGFSDQNQYLTRKVVGGVYPVSNDKELLPAPPVSTGGTNPNAVPGSGTEQPGWPMPFADILLNGTEKTFTNSGGVLSCADGSIETMLSGKFVRMNDNCGAINETAAAGDLDLGASDGTDCTVPAGHSAGDTHSSRTGFFEVNRIKEMARSWLPDNGWLKDQLTANMNIDNQCNAFWNGASINFYRKSPDPNPRCGNTGEIAAVFDHEWGHGMDENDNNPGISLPGEAPADIYAILRLNDSCIGRGFFLREFCSGQGDRCTSCTGVREADWMKRNSQKPHDITWILSPVTTPGTPARPSGGCVGAVIGPPPPIPGVTSGPCGQSTHCEGSVVTEVIWDLIHRDLAGAPFNLDVNTRLNLVTRLHYLGGGNVFFWFTCSPPDGGCAADSGYMNYLAVDDDDGNLSNGTPHMTAIFNAFNRHQMACPTPSAMNGGCATKPAATPVVTVTPLDNGARVSWGAVANAAKYWVFRTDSLPGQACNYGKERVAITSGTQFVDSNLLNGRTYFYTVEAVGENDSCRSSASTCASIVAGGAPIQSAANLAIVPGSTVFTPQTGDSDQFLDNCERARISFRVQNTGSATLTNVRIVRVEAVSHPQITILSTSAPLTALAACNSGELSFDLQADGLSFNDNVRFRVDLTANEFAAGEVRSDFFELGDAESDFAPQVSKTFHFDTPNDLEGWEVVRGTFTQTPPGAPTSVGNHLHSTTAQNGACDEIRSPLIRLTSTSTLSLQNQYNTEPPLPAFGDQFYDRANVGIFDVATNQRTTVVPDGGRPYNASGPNGACVTEGQRGWASEASPGETGADFAESSWSPAKLHETLNFVGRTTQIDVAYGTDPLLSGAGFSFDQVTITNFDLQVPDAQSNDCPPAPRPDLRVSDIVANNNKNVREGEKVTIKATIVNEGNADAPASTTRFVLDGTTVLGTPATAPVPAGGSVIVSVLWDTRGVKGQHVITVTADSERVVAESNEGNNTSTLTVTVQGNKVKNSSFEQANASGSGPDAWSGQSTGAGNASWSDGGSDGSKSAATSGNGGNAATSGSPSWTSDPIAVSVGEVLALVVSVNSMNASSAATAGLVYLGAAGQVLNSVTLLTAPLTTSGFAKLEQTVTIPAGVAQVRVKLVGFAATDLNTSGTVRFDEVGLFGN